MICLVLVSFYTSDLFDPERKAKNPRQSVQSSADKPKRDETVFCIRFTPGFRKTLFVPHYNRSIKASAEVPERAFLKAKSLKRLFAERTIQKAIPNCFAPHFRNARHASPNPDPVREGFVLAPAGVFDMLSGFVFSNAFQFEFFCKPHRKETLRLEVQLLGLTSTRTSALNLHLLC